ncbi:MAG: J domain-containing protein [Synechococcaceae cyanobacterium SM2_3_1]|nr:J domain-containing protein [Synechococcaceae cyanobacterium SM2_3_1]
MAFLDYYQLLQVDPRADRAMIKKAFRRLARQFHPDLAGAAATAHFQQLNEAYRVLQDPEQRRVYDQVWSTHQQRPQVKSSRSQLDDRIVVQVTSHSSQSDPSDRERTEALQRIRQALRAQRLGEAVASADSLQRRFPDAEDVIHVAALAYYRYGNRLITLGKPAQARAYLHKARDIEPHNRELAFEIQRDLQRLASQVP